MMIDSAMNEPNEDVSSSAPDGDTNDGDMVVDNNMHNTTTMNDEPPPRLMITKMVLENFKSYAGVKEIGPFHKCFSAVVGPNGSGKSNVIDAMLFVFGKRAKKLRLNKVSELIHKSDSVKDDPPTYARVSVHFHEIIDTGDGDDDYTVVPNTTMVVTRVAKMDNSSTYKLNGTTATFKEIANYLNSKGIDLDNNRFLILQGEVEMISMMPPKGKTESDEGLLEYLEDIIGSSQFVTATNEAAQKVDALTEVRQEKLNRVKAVEREKDNLEGAKLEAEALLAKEREIRRQQNILYHYYAMKAEKEWTEYTDQKNKVTEQLEAERERVAQATQRIQEIESGLVDQRNDYLQTKAELKRTKDEFSAYERRDIEIREAIKYERTNKKKLLEKLSAEEKKETAAANKKSNAEERIPDLEQSIVELTNAKSQEDATLEDIEEETNVITQKVRRQLEAKTAELAPVKQERAVHQAALDTAQTELDLMEDSTNRAKERLASAEKELQELDQTQQDKRTALKDQGKNLAAAKMKIVELEQEDRQLSTQEEALGRRHKELLTQVEDVKSALRSTGGGSSRSKAVQGILDATKKGGELSNVGVLGRLGDLATIPEKYDVAVSTACSLLDHIVVQTTAGAQRCMEFLRKYNLGRASFIPLDKQKKGAHDAAVETPENAPRLFDQIMPSNYALTPALFLAVGNTLVAPDLETATRWAYDFSKRWRVVTLDGKLIESSGTMSGGGKSVRRGGMRLSNSRARVPASPEDDEEALLEQLTQQVEEAQCKLQESRQRRRDIKDEIRKLTKDVKLIEVSLPKLTLEIEGCDTTREELTKLIPQLRVQTEMSADDLQKVLELRAKVEKCKSDMSTCVKLAGKLEQEVAKLQKDILDAGGPKLKNQKAKCEKILSQLNSAEKSLKSAKVDIVSSEKATVATRKVQATLKRQLEETEALLEDRNAEFKSLEANALTVIQAYDDVKEIEEKKRVSLENATKEVEELKQSQSAIQFLEIELVGQLDALTKDISECNKKKSHWDKEIAHLQECDDEEDGDDDDSSTSDAMTFDEVNNEHSHDVEMTGGETKSKTSVPKLSHSVLEKYDPEELQEVINTLQNERTILARNANMGAIEEYKKKEADYLSRVSELDLVTEERNNARKEHEELRRKRLEMFMDGFGTITLKLKEMYQMITLGGDAELELVDSLDPFSEGIVFSVRPPKKSWKNISNLSGGEKTLSSLSLVFALHHYKPTPLYVMDEIDAALDFKNVSIVANYIKERTKNAQFVIISLRNNMFELADRLVGIYKTHNASKSIAIDPKCFGSSGHQSQSLSSTPTALPLSERTNTSVRDAGTKVQGSMESDAELQIEIA